MMTELRDFDTKSECTDAGGSWYENDAHQCGVLEMMKLMYDSHQLTDVCVNVLSQRFHCHRAVLAATSCYFHAMFTSNLCESHQEEVNLHDVDVESVGALIDYAYTGRVHINRLNVQNLMYASSLFQVPAVFEACARYMETQLDDSNCIGVLCFAHIHNCAHLYEKAVEHVEKNFVQVSQGDEFMALEADRLFDIISSNELNVDREELVFEALMRWIHHQDKRVQYLSKLLPAIRFGLVSSRFIREHVLENRLITIHAPHLLPDVESLAVTKQEDFRLVKVSGRSLLTSTLRSGMIKPEFCLLLIGGVDDRHPSINCYNPLTRETYYLADVLSDFGRSGYYSIVRPACVVTEDNQVYLAGGSYTFHEQASEGTDYTCDEDSFEDYDDDIVGKNFYLFDGDHNVWRSRTSMLFPKSNFALASVGNKIYCFGGLSINQHPSEIIECYDISTNQWKYTGMMPTTLVDLTAVTHNQMIYIFGGRTGVTAYDSVLRYDPLKSEWTMLASMRAGRFNCGACVVAGEIYVIGGQIYSHNGGHTIDRMALRNVDIYNVERDRWRHGPPLPEPLYNVGTMINDGALFVCGTVEHYRITYRTYRCNVIYRLDLSKPAWTRVESELCTVRDFACVSARMHTRKLSQVFRPDVDT